MNYIFDIDMTLADNSHRQPYLEGEKKDWKGFFRGVKKDKPIHPMLKIIEALTSIEFCLDHNIYFVTGRPKHLYDETSDWLGEYCGIVNLFMRADGDFRKAHIVKSELIKSIPGIFDGPDKPVLFDDDPQMIEAAQKLGMITCHVNCGIKHVLHNEKS